MVLLGIFNTDLKFSTIGLNNILEVMITIDQDEVRNSLKDDAQNSEKVDSGMDDDSQQSNDHGVHCKSTSGTTTDFLYCQI